MNCFILILLSTFQISASTETSIFNCDLNCDTAILYNERNLVCSFTTGLDTFSDFTEDLASGTFHEIRYIVDHDNRIIHLTGYRDLIRNLDNSYLSDTVTLIEFEKELRITNELVEFHMDCHDFKTNIDYRDTVFYYKTRPSGTWKFYDKRGAVLKVENY